MIPNWANKFKKPGCTIKEINGKYYLYYATSKYIPEKKYPVSEQTYIGKITPEGIISERVSINVGKTEAKILGEIINDLPEELRGIIVLHVKRNWYFTKIDTKQKDELKKRGLYNDGKLNV